MNNSLHLSYFLFLYECIFWIKQGNEAICGAWIVLGKHNSKNNIKLLIIRHVEQL